MLTLLDCTPHHNRGLTLPEGFRATAARCGLKTEGNDLALLVADRPAAAAGVFTTNVVQASCVRHSRQVVRGGVARAIVVNAGNANACNGPQGDADTAETARLAAEVAGLEPSQVLVASTGVIGHLLPMDRIAGGIHAAAPVLARSSEADDAFARAIMTTDTRRKMIATEFTARSWDGPVRIGAVCKGSGMIAPNMATMLCFLTTDAQVPQEVLQRLLTSAVEGTFNRVTVDGDTSTNDMALMLASGASGAEIRGQQAEADFAARLHEVCSHLAREIARDGEGATKAVDITVHGAPDNASGARIAKTIAESPLVKTALFGCDPNWGRILAAAGRAGVPFDPDRVEVTICGTYVCRSGTGVPFDRDAVSALLKREDVQIVVDLHGGEGGGQYLTCDFSYDYVRINAEYHT